MTEMKVGLMGLLARKVEEGAASQAVRQPRSWKSKEPIFPGAPSRSAAPPAS